MCVSGLILDPEVPIRAVFTSFSLNNPLQPTTAAAIVRPAPTSSARSTNLGRKGTVLHRLRDFYSNVARPFALTGHPPRYGTSSVPATSSVTLVGPAPPGRKRTDTTATLLEKMPLSSSNAPQQQPQQDVLILPFQFSINLSRGVTRRHLPYLRHSWTRTDALSVIAFWIAFILAQTGVEHGSHHIGLFRALSVLRTARLLAITSGTTVRGTA
jgi:voltage-dependent calcium channel